MQEKSKLLFGEMLVADSIITRGQLDEALAIQETERKSHSEEVSRIGTILGRLGYLDKATLEDYIERVMKAYM